MSLYSYKKLPVFLSLLFFHKDDFFRSCGHLSLETVKESPTSTASWDATCALHSEQQVTRILHGHVHWWVQNLFRSWAWTIGLDWAQKKTYTWYSIQINQPAKCNSFTSLLLDVYVWLNMFRALLRPSSGAYNCTRSLCGDRPLPRLSGKLIHFPLSLGKGRSPRGYINQRLQIEFRASDNEQCAARKMLSLQ
jgi:hypothetical protein